MAALLRRFDGAGAGLVVVAHVEAVQLDFELLGQRAEQLELLRHVPRDVFEHPALLLQLALQLALKSVGWVLLCQRYCQ